MKSFLLLPALLACAIGVHAGPVENALERPSLLARHADQAVLLGMARAGKRLVAVGERGVVLLSDDDGARWRQVGVPVSVTLTAVRFADERVGYAVGHGGVVLSTADGGISWTRRLDGLRLGQIAHQAARGDPARQRDADRLVAEGADKPFLDLLVADPARVVVVGAYGLAFATADGGQTWESWMGRLPNPGGLHFYAVRAQGRVLLLAGEQGLVCRSEDGGATFTRLDTGYKGSFFTAELPSTSEMLLGGLRGNLWRSTDGGAEWIRIPLPAAVSLITSIRRDDGSALFFDQAGAAFSTREGRAAQLKAQLPPMNGVAAIDRGGLMAATFRGPVALPASAFANSAGAHP